MKTKLLAILALGLLAPASQAGVVVMQAKETRVEAKKPLRLKFEGPAEAKKVYLSFEGRLENPIARWRGGSMPCVRYLLNGVPLSSRRLVSLADAAQVPTLSGQWISWSGDGEGHLWRLPYSPDFTPLAADNNPAESGDNPYLHVFDVTDLVKKGQPNELVISHAIQHYPTFLLAFRNITLRDSPPPLKKVTIPFDVPDIAGRVIEPEARPGVAYGARLLPGGALEVAVGGDRYRIDSRFSRPGGGFFRLGQTAEGWRVGVKDRRVTAQAIPYHLERSIHILPECIEVRDRITNQTNGVLGVRFAHEIAISSAEVHKAYMNGLLLPRKVGASTVDVHPLENPTLYVTRQRSGLGLLPRDTVFRAQIQVRLADGAYGLHDHYFALARGASYELRWQIYPTVRPNYYAFINAARRGLKANYLIDGNVVIAHGYEIPGRFTDDDLRRLVRSNNARYVILSTIMRQRADGTRASGAGIEAFAHGTGLLGEHGRWNRFWLEKTLERFRRLAPDVKLLPYVDPYVSSEPDAAKKYADSLASMPNGAPQQYTDHKLPVFYPTATNSYGRELEKVFDYYEKKAVGFYMDESSMYHLPGAGAFSYRPDTWDSHSCEMELGKGPEEKGATYRVVRTLTNSALYTLRYRLDRQMAARKNGRAMWLNFQPVSEEEAALQAYRFVECYTNSAAVYCHLGCPLSLANPQTERTEKDIGPSVRRKLLFGGLYLTYGVKYTTDGNILQDLYPFEPLELHCGYVLGKDKILTCASGSYSFGDRSSVTVRIYDASGFRLTDREKFIKGGAEKTVAVVALRNNELAMLFRGPPPAK